MSLGVAPDGGHGPKVLDVEALDDESSAGAQKRITSVDQD
jgi:hypothetical protein